MFNSINVFTFSGRMGQDPEFSVSGDGLCISKFSVAISGYNNKEKEKTTMWMNCVAFGKTAENIEKWTKKGIRLNVSGSLQENKYTDRDGNKRNSYSVIVNSFEILESGG